MLYTIDFSILVPGEVVGLRDDGAQVENVVEGDPAGFENTMSMVNIGINYLIILSILEQFKSDPATSRMKKRTPHLA